MSKKDSIYTYAQMQKMQALPLENKINVANRSPERRGNANELHRLPEKQNFHCAGSGF